MVQGVTPAHKGLAPSRLIPYLRYDKDAHAGHTQRINAIRAGPQGHTGTDARKNIGTLNPANLLARTALIQIRWQQYGTKPKLQIKKDY